MAVSKFYEKHTAVQQNNQPETILEKALELTDAQERAAYLDEVCGKDAALRDEIESLLAAHFEADAFMVTLVDPVWQETATEKEGDRIGRYKLLQQIGEGGFGTVYLAEQTEPVKRRVALKVIKAASSARSVGHLGGMTYLCGGVAWNGGRRAKREARSGVRPRRSWPWAPGSGGGSATVRRDSASPGF